MPRPRAFPRSSRRRTLHDMTARTIRLLLAYDGTGFRGWASQGNKPIRTVEGTLAPLLSAITGEHVKVSRRRAHGRGGARSRPGSVVHHHQSGDLRAPAESDRRPARPRGGGAQRPRGAGRFRRQVLGECTCLSVSRERRSDARPVPGAVRLAPPVRSRSAGDAGRCGLPDRVPRLHFVLPSPRRREVDGQGSPACLHRSSW